MLTTVDPRTRDQFKEPSPEDAAYTLEALLESLIELPRSETSALLAALQPMLDDELAAARIQRELAARGYRGPGWLSSLSDTRAERAVEMVHVHGDDDSLLVGVRLPGGEGLTAMAGFDQNASSPVCDALFIPLPLDTAVAEIEQRAGGPGFTWNEVSLADARARLERGIEVGARFVPPYESESWPDSRPLLEWLVRRLPEGGVGHEYHDYSDAERKELMDRFFASPFAFGLDDPDYRDLLDNLVWFGCDYGHGGPLRWSPIRVQILLTSWLPRKIVAEAGYLTKAPTLLRAFIRFADDERGTPAGFTEETLEAVDEFEPDYQKVISPWPFSRARFVLCRAFPLLRGRELPLVLRHAGCQQHLRQPGRPEWQPRDRKGSRPQTLAMRGMARLPIPPFG